ncbi:hypothetical protein B0O99DRAFT_681156 [Bisporella sp. PMI_857]|nr:hypothetical protein B0O99DRAFT_681156 [Bisporella sp. PMI_857]
MLSLAQTPASPTAVGSVASLILLPPPDSLHSPTLSLSLLHENTGNMQDDDQQNSGSWVLTFPATLSVSLGHKTRPIDVLSFSCTRLP